GVARFLVDPDGRRVVVEPQPGAPQPLLRAFLLGRVLAILCFKRGLLPLHASCVRIGGRAHAFSGPRGTGKSTLAAAFLRRGHAVLADDLTVIDLAAPGGPMVWPSFPRLKLWRDAAQAMGVATDGLDRVEWVGDKFNVPLAEGFHADPLPLEAIDHIENGEGETTRRPLAGMAAVEAMLGAVYRMRIALRIGAGPAVMADVARLCRAAPGFRLMRRPGLDEIDAVAARYGPP
ncbi:MAG: serine kinase, partial [Alphaproteobacteria bacterium]|nr:serine kinase [Alphaproteobacteria bacterium]